MHLVLLAAVCKMIRSQLGHRWLVLGQPARICVSVEYKLQQLLNC